MDRTYVCNVCGAEVDEDDCLYVIDGRKVCYNCFMRYDFTFPHFVSGSPDSIIITTIKNPSEFCSSINKYCGPNEFITICDGAVYLNFLNNKNKTIVGFVKNCDGIDFKF